MVAALTLLPAMLGFIGPKVHEPQAEEEPGRERPTHRGGGQQGLLAQLGRPGAAEPWLSAGVALVVIIVIALPFFSLRLGSADQGTDPAGTPDPGGLRHALQGLRARLQRAR